MTYCVKIIIFVLIVGLIMVERCLVRDLVPRNVVQEQGSSDLLIGFACSRSFLHIFLFKRSLFDIGVHQLRVHTLSNNYIIQLTFTLSTNSTRRWSYNYSLAEIRPEKFFAAIGSWTHDLRTHAPHSIPPYPFFSLLSPPPYSSLDFGQLNKILNLLLFLSETSRSSIPGNPGY